jgi:antitoxin VapB
MSNANPTLPVEIFLLRQTAYTNEKKHDSALLLKPVMRGENLSYLNCQVYMLGIYLISEVGIMAKAKVFKSGNSQAVRLPKEFRFDVKEVEILRRGEEIVLRKPRRNLAKAFDALAALPEDFMAEGRQDEPPQEREPL